MTLVALHPAHIEQKAGWAPEPTLTLLPMTGIDSVSPSSQSRHRTGCDSPAPKHRNKMYVPHRDLGYDIVRSGRLVKTFRSTIVCLLKVSTLRYRRKYHVQNIVPTHQTTRCQHTKLPRLLQATL